MEINQRYRSGFFGTGTSSLRNRVSVRTVDEPNRKFGFLFRRCILAIALIFATPALADGLLKVQTTVPELAMLAKEVGGNRIQVQSLARGTQDPHFVDPRPSFIRDLNQADVFIQVGMELELGWAPVLLKQARNPKINYGAPGFIDASRVIVPRDRPTGQVDRSMGDVHPNGSPHYLSDPSAGLLVAGLIRDRFKQIDPAYASYYDAKYRVFEKELCTRLFGTRLTEQYRGKLDRLALLLHKSGYSGFINFLKKNGQEADLGGWLARIHAVQSRKFVGDHQATWSYLANVFGLEIIGYMESIAGVDPTTNHLSQLAQRMKSTGASYILSAAYYNPRYASFLAEKTGASILPMANQGDSRPGTSRYLDFVDYNVNTLVSGGAN